MHIDKPSAADFTGLNVSGYEVLTVIWELVNDGGNWEYQYSNAYVSKIAQ
jgi:hypothetical protein